MHHLSDPFYQIGMGFFFLIRSFPVINCEHAISCHCKIEKSIIRYSSSLTSTQSVWKCNVDTIFTLERSSLKNKMLFSSEDITGTWNSILPQVQLNLRVQSQALTEPCNFPAHETDCNDNCLTKWGLCV